MRRNGELMNYQLLRGLREPQGTSRTSGDFENLRGLREPQGTSRTSGDFENLRGLREPHGIMPPDSSSILRGS
jgi:hypothetical protein